MSDWFLKALLIAGLLSASAPCRAQDATAPQDAPDTEAEAERTIEDLNLVGAAVTMPGFSDTVLGVESEFRRALFRRGMALRVNVVPRYSQNLLDGPAPSGEQVYIGHRPTFISGVNPIFTWDLRQLGLRQAQLNIALGWRYTTWQPAGPNTVAMTSFHLFKGWGDRRVELKAGYLGNDLEFVGLQVGGSTSTGAQGVYAVLPNEVGLSYFPFTAPSFNVRLRGFGHAYLKTAAQRSLDAAGNRSTSDRNPSGFRFRPPGNGLLLIGEVGYQRPSSTEAPQAWLRAGYMRNSTLYTNRLTGQEEAGNYCAYVLVDYQLHRSDPASPGRGLYVGGTAMTVPSEFNAYDRYYEARAYQRGTFASRPGDVLALVASYRGHSQYFTDRLLSEGRTIWASSSSLTGTYTAHLARGNYLSLSLGYVRGAALSPRVDDTLTFTVNWGLYRGMDPRLAARAGKERLMKALTSWFTLVGACAMGGMSPATPVSAQTACADLAGGTFGNAVVLETEISGSTKVETAYGGGALLDRPICRVRGRIQPSSDSDIRFEVWLPEEGAWNGRYQGVGGGGNSGNIPLSSMKNALDGGYAVSGQDNGHVGRSDDSSYAVGHPEKVIDFGWRSLHEVAVASKAIVAAYYGRSPRLSLFNGCSTGGRQGLALAQRFPEDYDGIAAGAPANYWPELNALHADFGRFLVENPDSWVSPEKMKMVQDAVHEACGAVDGIIDDPGACTFDVSTLACAGEPAVDCLTEAEIAGVEKRFADLVDDDGALVYPGFTHGLDATIGPNWMGSDPEMPFYSSRTWRFPDRFFADYVHAREDWSVREFNWKTDLRAARNGVIGISVAAEDPDLSDFAERGGKLLQWHGWQDMGIPARNSIRYYEEIRAETGSDAAASFYRLFMGTGVDHCGGGLGPDSIGSTFGRPAPQRDADHDVMEALARWIEEGRAPERLIATRWGDDGSVVAQRPWCAYPRVARWDGHGDRRRVESYTCSE